MEIARVNHAAVSLNEEFILIAGGKPMPLSPDYFNSCECFDTKSNKWINFPLTNY